MKIFMVLSLFLSVAKAETLFLNHYLWQTGHPNGHDLNSIKKAFAKAGKNPSLKVYDSLVIRPLKKWRGKKENSKLVTLKKVLYPNLKQFRTLKNYLELTKTKSARLDIESSAWPSKQEIARLNKLNNRKLDLEITVNNCLNSKVEFNKIKSLKHGNVFTVCKTKKGFRTASFFAKSLVNTDLNIFVKGKTSSTSEKTITTAIYPTLSKVKKYKKMNVTKLIIKSQLWGFPSGGIGNINYNLSTLVDIPSHSHIRNMNAMKDFASIEIYPFISALPSNSRVKRINKLGEHIKVEVFVRDNCPDSKNEFRKFMNYKRPVKITLECRTEKGLVKAIDNAKKAMESNPNLNIQIDQIFR